MHCKKERWGDCYDQALEKVNWQFIVSARDLVAATVKGRMEMRFDLSNAGVYGPAPACAGARQRDPCREVLHSAVCGSLWGGGHGSFLRQTDRPDGSKSLLRIYDELGIKPTHLDMHTPIRLATNLPRSWIFAAGVADQYGVTLTIGEMFYQNREQDEIIARAVAAHPRTRTSMRYSSGRSLPRSRSMSAATWTYLRRIARKCRTFRIDVRLRAVTRRAWSSAAQPPSDSGYAFRRRVLTGAAHAAGVGAATPDASRTRHQPPFAHIEFRLCALPEAR